MSSNFPHRDFQDSDDEPLQGKGKGKAVSKGKHGATPSVTAHVFDVRAFSFVLTDKGHI